MWIQYDALWIRDTCYDVSQTVIVKISIDTGNQFCRQTGMPSASNDPVVKYTCTLNLNKYSQIEWQIPTPSSWQVPAKTCRCTY